MENEIGCRHFMPNSGQVKRSQHGTQEQPEQWICSQGLGEGFQWDTMRVMKDEPDQINIVAGICAVLLPGLGHIVSGRAHRGVLAMIGVLGLFGLGLLVGGIDAVDSKGGTDKYWFIGQAMVGPIAFGVDYAHQNHFKAYDLRTKVNRTGNPHEDRVHDGSRWVWKPMSIDRINAGERGDANIPGLGRLNEIAMLSCTLAGMLNLIIFLDALLPTGYGGRKDEPVVEAPA